MAGTVGYCLAQKRIIFANLREILDFLQNVSQLGNVLPYTYCQGKIPFF